MAQGGGKYKGWGRKDLNQDIIVEALEKAGASVLDLSALGGGVPDLAVSFRGVIDLIEIKNPSNSYGKRGLNKRQQTWVDAWRGKPVIVVRTVEEALRAIGALREPSNTVRP